MSTKSKATKLKAAARAAKAVADQSGPVVNQAPDVLQTTPSEENILVLLLVVGGLGLPVPRHLSYNDHSINSDQSGNGVSSYLVFNILFRRLSDNPSHLTCSRPLLEWRVWRSF